MSDVSIDQEESQSSNQLGQAIHLQLSNDLGQNTQPPNDLGQATHLQPSNDLGQNTQPSNDPGRTAQPPSSNSPGQTTDKGRKLYSISYQLYIYISLPIDPHIIHTHNMRGL